LNTLGVPLSYVIRKDDIDVIELDARTKQMIDNAPLTGAVFRSDSTKVLSLLRLVVNGTDAEVWMKGSNCGRVAMQQLQAHYDGDAEADKRKKGAEADLKILFYKHEAVFSFEKNINRMKKCFNVMEKYKKPYYEEDKVNFLLDKIQTTHAGVRTHVDICRANYAKSFTQASTYLSREISRMFPSSNVSSAQFGKGKKRDSRNVSEMGRSGG
jgi:hypothetical protein